MKLILPLLIALLGLPIFAHEGAHGPAQKLAPHGGVLFDGKSLMGELVQSNEGVKIYFLSHKSAPIAPSAVTIVNEKIVLTDSKKKGVSFKFVVEKDFVSLKFDKSKSYRFSLNVPLVYGKNQDSFIWGFEPQSN